MQITADGDWLRPDHQWVSAFVLSVYAAIWHDRAL